MAKGPALQTQTANAILDRAAVVLTTHRDAASLADIAQEAGVARSTLYRYFPSRDALVRALAQRAADELRSRVEEAELETLPVPEAIARVTRGFIATGAKYAALAYVAPKPADAADAQLNDPLLRLFQRGIDDGSLRNDVAALTLLGMYGDLIQGAIARATRDHEGVEPASAAILAVFLNGARPRS